MPNASARKTYVYFGDSGIDVTEALVSCDMGWELRSESGILPTTGELVLAESNRLPAVCNPRLNPGKLYRGTKIRVRVELHNGTIIDHSRGILYVLDEPDPPAPDKPEISFSLGCEPTLNDWTNPNTEAEDAEISGLRNRTEVVRKLLGLSRFRGTFVGDIPEYPLDVPPDRGGGYVERAGKVAWGGLKFLYQNSEGNIDTHPISLTNITPSQTFYVGQDEVDYREVTGGEPLCEELKTTGVSHAMTPNYRTTTYLNRSNGLAQMINPDLAGDIIIRQTSGSITISATLHLEEEVTLAPGGLAAPRGYPKSLEMIESERRRAERHFEAGGERRLIRIFSVTHGLADTVLGSFIDQIANTSEDSFYDGLYEEIRKTVARQWIEAERSETRYFYRTDGTVAKIEQTTWKPLGAIVQDENFRNYLDMQVAEKSTTEWSSGVVQVGNGATIPSNASWRMEVTTYVPANQVGSINLDGEFYTVSGGAARAAVKSALILKDNNVKYSNAGQTQPPSAERADEPFTATEIPLESVVKFNIETPYQPRVKVVQVESCVSQTQLAEIGQIVGAVLFGRARGSQFQLPLTDAILQERSPLPIWKFVLEDGSAHIVQVDGLQYSHNPDRAICSATGIRLLTQPPGSNTYVASYPAIAFDPPKGDISTTPQLLIPKPPIIVKNLILGTGGGLLNDWIPIQREVVRITSLLSGTGIEFEPRVEELKTPKDDIWGTGIGLEFGKMVRRLGKETIWGTGIGVVFNALNLPIKITELGTGMTLILERVALPVLGTGAAILFEKGLTAPPPTLLGTGGGWETTRQTFANFESGTGMAINFSQPLQYGTELGTGIGYQFNKI